ncbi:MAG: F0F1 ATP synthase subunit delta [Legionellaceae bacterium]|nr:F0F1 ATP synthase subunit delta [Legionellaceae bacterium]
MSNANVIARPYAKAVFESAVQTKMLPSWAENLKRLALAVSDKAVVTFIQSPETTEEQCVQLFMALFPGKENQHVLALVQLLGEHNRFLVIPDIYVQFEALRAEHEKTLSVQVLSYMELENAEQEALKKALSARLSRTIILDITIDPSLLGGVIIQAGDFVMDGSVRGKLEKLRTTLMN